MIKAKHLQGAKFMITVVSQRGEQSLRTAAVHDCRTGEDWLPEQVRERGVLTFSDMRDMADTLNWCLNGDSSRFRFQWGQTGRSGSTGYAFVFD